MLNHQRELHIKCSRNKMYQNSMGFCLSDCLKSHKEYKLYIYIYILIIYLMLTLEIISTYRNLHNILIQNGVLDGTHLGKYWSYRHIKYIGY